MKALIAKALQQAILQSCEKANQIGLVIYRLRKTRLRANQRAL
jgi:hypothetical protein